MKYSYILYIGILNLCLMTWNTNAQDKIKHISDYYQQLDKMIEVSQKDSVYGELYCNKIEINPLQRSWRAVGNYSKNIFFWYDDEPHLSDEEKPVNVLKKVTIIEYASVRKYYKEYVFEAGKLIFYFEKNEEDEIIEKRAYFFADKPVRWMLNQQTFDKFNQAQSQEMVEIQKKAKKYQHLFLKSFDADY